MPQEVFEKWGFGMAPPKPAIQYERLAAVAYLSDLLEGKIEPSASPDILERISIVKGLFNRIVREDQWDWFTVMGQFGYPSSVIARAIANELARLRTAMAVNDIQAFNIVKRNVIRLPTRRCLSVFLGRSKIADEDGAGWLYILSTRELKNLLKIGITTRTVEERVREINAATGVAIPFGVRRCWRVSDPVRAEKTVHQALAGHRVRKDREFFRADFKVAAAIIRDVLTVEGLEIRTLAKPAALADRRMPPA